MTGPSLGEFSDITVDYETIVRFAACLPAEPRNATAADSIVRASVQEELGAIHGVVLSYSEDLINVSPIVAESTTSFRVFVPLSLVRYGRAAEAAQNCMSGEHSSV